MLESKQLREGYCELMFEEFFENPEIWRQSLAVANSLLIHLNDISDTAHPDISYNEYCAHSKQVVRSYMEKCDINAFLKVEIEEVYSLNRNEKLFDDTFEHEILYEKTVEDILRKRMQNLEKDLHRMCALAMLRSIDEVVYDECQSDFESMYDTAV